MASIESSLFTHPGSSLASANIVVIGGGLTGLEVAKELDRFGATGVVVLEGGPADDPAHINSTNSPGDALRLWLKPDSDRYFWRPWVPESPPHYDRTAGMRRRLGGRSLYWHGVTLPIESWALCAPWWPETIVRDLTSSWRGGPSLYDLVRADIAAWRGEEREPGAALPPLTVGGRHLTPTPQAVRRATRNDEQRWSAYSALHHWSDKRATTGLTGSGVRVVTGTEVLGVKVQGGRVNSVVADTAAGRLEISCGSAVLAAGTIENSRIAIQAMRSAGTTEKDYLHGLADHIVQGFIALVEPDAVPEEIRVLAAADAFYVTPCAPEARSNLFMRLYANGTGTIVFDVWAMGEQLPSAKGVVRCADTGDWPRKVFVRAGLTDDDWRVVYRQRDELSALWAGLCDELGRAVSPLDFPDFINPARMLENLLPTVTSMSPMREALTWSGPLGSEYHEACTLPLGELVDDNQQLADIAGLYVTGPAIFPRPGAANPSLTSLALSKRLARLLGETL